MVYMTYDLYDDVDHSCVRFIL